MADKKAPENAAPAAPAADEKPKKKGKMKLLMVIGGLMAVEGAGVFYVTNMLSAKPESAAASEESALTDDHASDKHADKHGAKPDEHAKDKDPGKDAHGASAEKPKDDHAGKPKDDHGAKPKDDHGGGGDHGGGHGSEPAANDGAMPPPPPMDGMSEIEIADSRLHNVRSGRSMIVRIKVSCLVTAAKSEQLKTLITQRKSRLHERVCSVIRNAEPKLLDEPGLETVKRQLKYELSQVLGDPELIRDILIPELLHD